MSRNPYTTGFGRIPKQYINRDLVVDEILDALEGEGEENQAFKLTGIRGTGKTVTLTTIEKQLRSDDNWIVVGLRSSSNLIEDLAAELYSSVPFVTEFIDAELNLSKFGIGLNISEKSPVASIDFALKAIMRRIKKQGKKVLVTIDEARKNAKMVSFVELFQLLIREELPIYLIVAGLYEDIESLENSNGLTFFLRAEKYEMTPLNEKMMAFDYQKTLLVTYDVAKRLAQITKGYAFAYQALGKYMWDSKTSDITEEVLVKLDAALAEKVYDKIWKELSDSDRYYLRFIAGKDKISVSELLEAAKKKHSEFSEPRKRLKEKGIIDTQVRGQISIKLPRFGEYIKAAD